MKLFKDAFPYSKNNFKVGMKLEGIDPNHPSQYCVLTVAEVVGEFEFISIQRTDNNMLKFV